jgi:hypothetical protein
VPKQPSAEKRQSSSSRRGGSTVLEGGRRRTWCRSDADAQKDVTVRRGLDFVAEQHDAFCEWWEALDSPGSESSDRKFIFGWLMIE